MEKKIRKTRMHDAVESYSVKVAKGQYIDLFLHRSDEPEKGSFIKLTLFNEW